ncbi:hypothetical protein ACI784_11970 [Geodermatophilus sp. SYSU D01186]
MPEFAFEVVAEDIQSLEEIGVAEGCTTCCCSCSLDIADAEFE